MDFLSRDGRRVYWIGQPVMRAGDFDQKQIVLEGIYREEAALHPNVTFIHLRSMFAGPGGAYTAYLPDASGKEVLMRAQDGVHLSLAGSNLVGQHILETIQSRHRRERQRLVWVLIPACARAPSTTAPPGGSTGSPGNHPSSRPIATLPRAWAARWAAAPGAPVVKDARTSWITGADLEERTAEAAGRLAGLGVGVGDRVLMSCDPSVDLVVAHVGALRLGAIVVPVNTAFGPAELGNVWREARPVVALLDDPARLPDAPVRPPSLDGVTPVSVTLDQSDTDDPAMLMFTSGTTGRPKGAILSHGNTLASAEGVHVAWRWTSDDRLVLTLPLFHMHGLGVGVHGTLLAGASAVIAPFSPDTVLDVAAAEKGEPVLRRADDVCATRREPARRRALGVAVVRVGFGCARR